MKEIIDRSNAGMTISRAAIFSMLLVLAMSSALAQSPANVPCGLIGWWPLDGNAVDIRNGNNGTIQGNGGAFAPAMVQQGWRSGGQGSVIVVPNSGTLNVAQFSIDFWINLTAINVLNMPVVWQGNSGGASVTSPFGVSIRGARPTTGTDPGIAGAVQLAISNGTNTQFVWSSVALPTGVFKHITVTADGTQINIYIDGLLDAASPANQIVVPVHGSFPFQIGGISNASAANFLNGIIDELEVFNRPLDPAPKSEIRAIFLAGATGKCR